MPSQRRAGPPIGVRRVVDSRYDPSRLAALRRHVDVSRRRRRFRNRQPGQSKLFEMALDRFAHVRFHLVTTVLLSWHPAIRGPPACRCCEVCRPRDRRSLIRVLSPRRSSTGACNDDDCRGLEQAAIRPVRVSRDLADLHAATMHGQTSPARIEVFRGGAPPRDWGWVRAGSGRS